MDKHVLDTLFTIIQGKLQDDPDTSYTARLAHKGRGKIAQKVGEEAVETVIAAISDDHDELMKESADLLYHLLVLWAEAGLSDQDVYAELARRQGIGGLVEKASRKAGDNPGAAHPLED